MESLEIWCWSRIEKKTCPEKVTNEILGHIGEKWTLLNNILRRKTNWIGHILIRYCLLHVATEGKIMEVKRVGRGTKLLDDLRNRRKYWELKGEAEGRRK